MNDEHSGNEVIATTPYWWESKLPSITATQTMETTYDVAIIGGGYTGLSAAIRLAKAGASVAVFEAEQLGYGASTRNGGMVSGVLKLAPHALARRTDSDTCRSVFNEAQSAVIHLEQLIEEESIDCSYERCGMFFAAYTARHLGAMYAEQRALEDVGVQTHVLSKEESRGELNSERYFGGKVLPLAGGLHPAAFHNGLARAAVRHGASLFEHNRVTALERQHGRWRLASARGNVEAHEVLVATNGYSRGGPSSLERRLIPIRSYVIATEPMSSDVVRALFPSGKMIQDTKNLLYYFRPSPDRTRIIFGGRASFVDIDLTDSARRLVKGLREIFPSAMQGVEVSHSWNGTVAFTFDRLPHIGVENGLNYAMGYCGQGVALSTYLGDRAAQAILEPTRQVSVFQRIPLEGKIGYSGNPWMLPVVSFGLKTKDFIDRYILA